MTIVSKDSKITKKNKNLRTRPNYKDSSNTAST